MRELEAKRPRQAFQQAFALGWISDEGSWAAIVRAHKLAVHAYRQEHAEALYREPSRFHAAFQELQEAIASR